MSSFASCRILGSSLYAAQSVCELQGGERSLPSVKAGWLRKDFLGCNLIVPGSTFTRVSFAQMRAAAPVAAFALASELVKQKVQTKDDLGSYEF